MIFCKAPVPGQVKTRLAETIGDDLASKLHTQFALHCMNWVTRAKLAPVDVWCWPNLDAPFFQHCKKTYGVGLRAQPEGDLGVKMQAAFAQTLTSANYALAIGTDCLVLDEEILFSALQSLRQGRQGVIAPAEDGGYVLLGLSELQKDLFQDMPWSQSGLMAKTRQAMRGHWQELSTLWDIDRLADLQRLRDTIQEEKNFPSLREVMSEVP
jgi:rSAM/selenodomain-associated transferase 1